GLRTVEEGGTGEEDEVVDRPGCLLGCESDGEGADVGIDLGGVGPCRVDARRRLAVERDLARGRSVRGRTRRRADLAGRHRRVAPARRCAAPRLHLLALVPPTREQRDDDDGDGQGAYPEDELTPP